MDKSNISETTPFLFLCVFWGIPPPSRRTLGRYAGGAPPILYVLTFPRKYFCFTKLENKKRVVYIRGGSRTCAFSWGLGTALDAPTSGEHTCIRTSPTTRPKIVCDKSPYHQNILMFKWHLKTLSPSLSLSHTHTHTHLRSISIHFCYENVIVLMLKVKPMDFCDLWFYFCDFKHQFGTFEKVILMICWSCYKTVILCVWNSTQMQEKENLFVARFFLFGGKNSPVLGIF
jgi:hypothetical protein